MAITLQQAEESLQMWLDAERAIATAQSYTIGSRNLTRANLAEVTKRIKYWEDKVAELKVVGVTGKRLRRTKQFIPRDY